MKIKILSILIAISVVLIPVTYTGCETLGGGGGTSTENVERAVAIAVALYIASESNPEKAEKLVANIRSSAALIKNLASGQPVDQAELRRQLLMIDKSGQYSRYVGVVIALVGPGVKNEQLARIAEAIERSLGGVVQQSPIL